MTDTGAACCTSIVHHEIMEWKGLGQKTPSHGLAWVWAVIKVASRHLQAMAENTELWFLEHLADYHGNPSTADVLYTAKDAQSQWSNFNDSIFVGGQDYSPLPGYYI